MNALLPQVRHTLPGLRVPWPELAGEAARLASVTYELSQFLHRMLKVQPAAGCATGGLFSVILPRSLGGHTGRQACRGPRGQRLGAGGGQRGLHAAPVLRRSRAQRRSGGGAPERGEVA